jgi:[CysO sulfur-carrier protein]-thiocarboxylate-dependent cysteine synthase
MNEGAHEGWPRSAEGLLCQVGNTPLLEVDLRSPRGQQVRVQIKLEGANPSGSVKDRAAAAMIRRKIASAELQPGMILLDASSGNMGCSLAMFGRALGLDVHLVCNPTLTADKRRFIEYFGARVLENADGRYTYDAYVKCRALAAEDDSYCFLDQLHNWDNPRAHELGTGREILRDLPSAKLIVGSLGSGGTMLGVAMAARDHRPDLRVVAVCSSAGSRLPGVGAFDDGDYVTPFIAKAWDEGMFERTLRVAMPDVLRQLDQLRSIGVFCGPQTGAVIAGALGLADEVAESDDVVVISGDAGWKNWQYLASLR